MSFRCRNRIELSFSPPYKFLLRRCHDQLFPDVTLFTLIKMKVTRLTVSNFKGVAEATLLFEGHTLMVGSNNVGKSTVCEALDLVLGPDRLSKSPPLDEYDFYNSQYLEADGATPKPLRIEVILLDLSIELASSCSSYLEFWHKVDHRILGEGEIELTTDPNVERCLRLETNGRYDLEEDDFVAQTFYSHTLETEGELKPVSKAVKRQIGFLYLRAIRTGSRALSLEHGSLLDIILRLGKIRTGLWESSIKQLRELNPPISDAAPTLSPILESIEKRLTEYIPTGGGDATPKLYVSQLTREHLRRTISFFLSTAVDQIAIPFQEAGTGTLNTLVLALLSILAEMKGDNVIFAMEEPEIALPPHTQRRIADYLLAKTTQCFVTSHSPYVIERFDPDHIRILRRSNRAVLSATHVTIDGSIKPKMYRKHARRGLCEAMLGKGVVVAEGLTEQISLWAVAAKLETSLTNYPLDLSGITIFSSDGDGSLHSFGSFFKNLGLVTYAFYDQKLRSSNEVTKINAAFDLPFESPYTGTELLLTTETPVNRQWQLLETLRDEGNQGSVRIPTVRPDDATVSDTCLQLLKGRKGDGTAGRLIEMCDVAELPRTIVTFLNNIYLAFPRPTSIVDAVSNNIQVGEVSMGEEAA
jgi:putative ATP-dependent endonuclease of the OLD family